VGGNVAADATIFFGLWLQKPLRIAAANPSGARLADAIARHVELERPGPVLELGAGTGSLTRGLVRAGCPPERIIALEREPRLVTVLRREFPGMTVIEGDATRIGEYLEGRAERLSAVVSSLPIKWFPVEAQRAIVKQCFELLGPSGRFLQLTNAFSSPLAIDQLGIAGQEICRIWLNLLPAQIWSYSQRSQRPGSIGTS
jgi:phosphatidylethanolamine/phosphatidyl-N-methylethanolamine N-methyltransferase